MRELARCKPTAHKDMTLTGPHGGCTLWDHQVDRTAKSTEHKRSAGEQSRKDQRRRPLVVMPLERSATNAHLDDPVYCGDVQAACRHVRAQQDATVCLHRELEKGINHARDALTNSEHAMIPYTPQPPTHIYCVMLAVVTWQNSKNVVVRFACFCLPWMALTGMSM